MGIKNLKKLIKKHAPDAISDLPSLYNKKIAIDSSILLYKFFLGLDICITSQQFNMLSGIKLNSSVSIIYFKCILIFICCI